MRKLVNFLVEEKYCNTQSEAIKILESVSDEFYNYLIEAENLTGKERIKDIQTRRAPERHRAMSNRLKNMTTAAQRNPGSITPKQVRQIRMLRLLIPDQQELASLEMEKRKKEGTASKGLSPTPTGRGGRRVQKPRDQISTIGTTAGIQRTDTGKYSKAATILTGKPLESGTSELVGGRFTDKAVSGAGGTNQARSGGTRGVRTRNG